MNMFDIYLYNSLSRKKEKFEPLKKGVVGIYQCGPTVYDTPHIGNYRSFVMGDIMRRVLEYNDYSVIQTMNITDVDDKTIRKSHEQGVPLNTITKKYERLFLEDLQSLNVLTPHHVVRATEHVEDMISLVQILLDKKIAYKTDDGIYMSIAKVKNYGLLARIDTTKLSTDKITHDEYNKNDPRDFALWKFKTPEDKEVSWQASFGEGRPGWHIECSAMSMKIFGPTIDIHIGGTDLVFPHHTNEIAQSESTTGKTFVRYWVHGAFMTMNQEKMAKSKQNTIKLQDLIQASVSPLAYRYWLLTAHYRSLVNFGYEALHGAQNALIRLLTDIGSYPDGGNVSLPYQNRFRDFVNDDMDMPKAIALVWEINRDKKISDADKKATLIDFDKVFGLKLSSVPKTEKELIPPEIQALGYAREQARKNKEWDKADALRTEINTRGYVVHDAPDGISITKL